MSPRPVPVAAHSRTALALTLVFGLGASLFSSTVSCDRSVPPPASAVALVTVDGVRWQEVFRGMDPSLLGDDARPLLELFDGATPEERRQRLMPFLWRTVAREGQLFGDRGSGGELRVTNGQNFSYPGYQELLAGFPDPRITSNEKLVNPSSTVLAWLNRRPRLAGRVAAFASWDVFPFILAEERSGVPVNAGWEPTGDGNDPADLMLDRLQGDVTREWDSVRFDAFTFHAALAYLRHRRPRVLYLALGEPDDWGHEGRYDRYLLTVHRADDYLRRLWQALQEEPSYAGNTTLLVTTDHGRGRTPLDWTDHGAEVAGSEYAWAAALGPQTPARGIRADAVTLAQIAATMAAAVGEPYAAAVPGCAPPLPGVIE